MRHLIIYIVAIMSIFSSCEQDSYDKGEGTYSNMTADFVEAHVNSEKKIDYAITDNGDIPAPSGTSPANAVLKPFTSTPRFFISCTMPYM